MVPRPRNGLSLCAGAGGLDMGVMLAEPDFHARCYVEWEDYPRQSIIAAQRAGYFAPAPIWDDVTTFDGTRFRGAIDTVLAGYPCQPFSAAGQRKGEKDERHLWPDVARIIREIEPRWVFLENVSGHVSLGLDTVLREIRDMGWTPASGIFSAGETGAPHERQRVFIVAYRDSQQFCTDDRQPNTQSDMRNHLGWGGGDAMADAQSIDRRSKQQTGPAGRGRAGSSGDGASDVENPGHAQRGPITARGHIGNGDHAGRPETDRGVREPSETLDHTSSPRHEPTGQRSGAISKGGQPVSGEGCAELADTEKPGSQGRWTDDSAQGRQEPTGSTRLHGRTGLFPPGPSDGAAWSATLAMAPDLAPAVAFGDIARRADQLAQMVASGELAETEAEPALCGMVDGLAQRSRALRLLGNGVHPLAAANAWRSLADAHGLRPLDLGTADHHTPNERTSAEELV
jgi:DNA (cytosine-5)-methyltransferase 1